MKSNRKANTKATRTRSRNPEATRAALVGAAVELILRQGFAATSVGQICDEAGVTKGSFFHHFDSKDAIGRAAIEWWGDFGTNLYAEAWKDAERDPLEKIGRLFAIMEGFTEHENRVCTCVVGIMSQETAQSNDELRQFACRELERWSENVGALIASAKERHCPEATFDPVALAWHLNALWQGSMLIAKTLQDPSLIRRNLSLGREWLAGFFPDDVRSRLLSSSNLNSIQTPSPNP
ncbi:MAG: TetR/AcrR family transcriptional regulator [Verrucomicrobiae bacterium]|nr:TetR/AcrR family transcriptional regulator [Verrucomicrobiae bacterium]